MRRWTWRWRCFWLDADLTMVNRLHFMLDDELRWFGIQWGNGNSDPVWSLQVGPRRGPRHSALAAGLRSWWLHRDLGDGRLRSAYCYVRAAIGYLRLERSLPERA